MFEKLCKKLNKISYFIIIEEYWWDKRIKSKSTIEYLKCNRVSRESCKEYRKWGKTNNFYSLVIRSNHI